MSKTEVVIVARGRTVRADGAVHGPGTELTFSAAEAENLIDLGFVHRPGEQPRIPHVIQPMSASDMDRLPPGPVPLARGMAVGPKVFT